MGFLINEFKKKKRKKKKKWQWAMKISGKGEIILVKSWSPRSISKVRHLRHYMSL
jgi:hypothetical protein